MFGTHDSVRRAAPRLHTIGFPSEQLCCRHEERGRRFGRCGCAGVFAYAWRGGNSALVAVEAGDVDDVVNFENSDLREPVATPTPL